MIKTTSPKWALALRDLFHDDDGHAWIEKETEGLAYKYSMMFRFDGVAMEESGVEYLSLEDGDGVGGVDYAPRAGRAAYGDRAVLDCEEAHGAMTRWGVRKRHVIYT